MTKLASAKRNSHENVSCENFYCKGLFVKM